VGVEGSAGVAVGEGVEVEVTVATAPGVGVEGRAGVGVSVVGKGDLAAPPATGLPGEKENPPHPAIRRSAKAPISLLIPKLKPVRMTCLSLRERRTLSASIEPGCANPLGFLCRLLGGFFLLLGAGIAISAAPDFAASCASITFAHRSIHLHEERRCRLKITHQAQGNPDEVALA